MHKINRVTIAVLANTNGTVRFIVRASLNYYLNPACFKIAASVPLFIGFLRNGTVITEPFFI